MPRIAGTDAGLSFGAVKFSSTSACASDRPDPAWRHAFDQERRRIMPIHPERRSVLHGSVALCGLCLVPAVAHAFSTNQPNASSFSSGNKVVISSNEIGFQIPDQQIWGIGPDLLITVTNVSAILFLASPPNGPQTAHYALSMNVTCNGWYTVSTGPRPPTPGMYFGLELQNAFGGGLLLWNTPRFDILCDYNNRPQVWQNDLDPNLFPLTERVQLHVFNDVNFFGCHG